MNIRLRAALYTIGFLCCVGAGAISVVALATFGGVDPTVIFAILLVGFGVWTLYELMLSKLKMDQEIDAIDRRIEERSK
jgi:hypothetical protein